MIAGAVNDDSVEVEALPATKDEIDLNFGMQETLADPVQCDTRIDGRDTTTTEETPPTMEEPPPTIEETPSAMEEIPPMLEVTPPTMEQTLPSDLVATNEMSYQFPPG